MGEQSLIDRWITRLSSDSQPDEDTKRDLLHRFQKLYEKELVLMRELEAEARHLPYPHLTEAALKIVEDKQKDVQTIAGLIREFGGTPEAKTAEDHRAEPTGEFTRILALENEIGEQLIDDANWAEDLGLEQQAHLLMQLKEKHYGYQEAIESLIMKINGAL